MSLDDLFHDKSVVPILLFVFAVLAIVALIYNRFLYSKEQYKRTEDLSKPSEHSKARIIAKEIASNNIYCYLTFQLSNGIRKKFTIPKTQVSLLVENDIGMLEYRGDTFISFTRLENSNE